MIFDYFLFKRMVKRAKSQGKKPYPTTGNEWIAFLVVILIAAMFALLVMKLIAH